MQLGVRQRGLLAFRDACQGGFEHVEAFVELLVGNNERNQNANDIVERACRDHDEAVLVAIFGDLLCFGVGGFTSFGVTHEFYGAHGAKAANLANQGPFFLPAAGAFLEMFSDGGRARKEAIFFDGFDSGKRGGARSRVAAVGAAERAGPWRVHNFSTAGDGGYGHSAAERFRRRDEIRFDTEMLGSKPFAGAREAGLDFVGNEENAVLAANILEKLEVIVRRNNEAAFAENGFDDQGSDGFRRNGALERVFEMMREFRGRRPGSIAIWIGKGNAVDIAGERLKARFIRMRFAGQRH